MPASTAAPTCGCRSGNPRTRELARGSCARGIRTTGRLHARRADVVQPGEFRLHDVAAAAQRATPPTTSCSDTRSGFCEHYASAFVVLLRAAGIPARVVTGYQGGTMNPRGGYMIVRQSDAHAWAEALIDGRWQRFDPTAAVSPSRIEVGLGGALPSGERVPFLARLDMSLVKSVQTYLGRVQPRLAAAMSSDSTISGSVRCGGTGGSTDFAPWHIVGHVGGVIVRVGAAWSWHGCCSAVGGRSARWSCGTISAGALRAPACRGRDMKVRSHSRSAPRSAGRNSRSPSRPSASRSPRCATAPSTRRANATRWSRRSSARSRCCRRRPLAAAP